MQRFTQTIRSYCIIARKTSNNQSFVRNKKNHLNYKELNHVSKVPRTPVIQSYPVDEKPVIDSAIVQLLERLALVNLESKEALKTLENSIEFAEKISHIDTANVLPLYTVVEDQNLYLREDRLTEGNCREEILSGAKISEEDYFVSPPGNIPLQQKEKDFCDN